MIFFFFFFWCKIVEKESSVSSYLWRNHFVLKTQHKRWLFALCSFHTMAERRRQYSKHKPGHCFISDMGGGVSILRCLFVFWNAYWVCFLLFWLCNTPTKCVIARCLELVLLCLSLLIWCKDFFFFKLKLQARIVHIYGGREVQDQGFSRCAVWRRPTSWFVDSHPLAQGSQSNLFWKDGAEESFY